MRIKKKEEEKIQKWKFLFWKNPKNNQNAHFDLFGEVRYLLTRIK